LARPESGARAASPQPRIHLGSRFLVLAGDTDELRQVPAYSDAKRPLTRDFARQSFDSPKGRKTGFEGKITYSVCDPTTP
jgi:hypothetical protein